MKTIIIIVALLFIVFTIKKGNKNIPKKNKRTKRNKTVPNLTKEKISHYQQFDMDEKQILFFRETMAVAKTQIEQLDTNMNASAKLKAINLRNDTIKTSKAMFKELVKDPTRLHYADKFLYTHLPNLVELTSKYIEINQHKIKSKETYQTLEESAQVIDEMSKLLLVDYQSFISNDLEDMQIEISVAKQSLNRDNTDTTDKIFAAFNGKDEQ